MSPWIGLSASRSQSQLLTFQRILLELNVRDVNKRRYRVIEEDQTLLSLSKLRINLSDRKREIDWVLVCSLGRWIGYITEDPLKNLPVQYWDKHLIRDYVKPLSDLPSIGERSPLWKAVIKLQKASNGRLLVMNLAGLPSSTIDKVDVGEAVLKRLGINIPKSLLDSARDQNSYPLGMALPKVVETMIASGKIDLED